MACSNRGKIINKTLDGIYVNEASLIKLKASMGDSPYVLVPTHRSYGDFILMAFICFVYEIEIPCVAAGLDFLSMWVMGEVLRKTKAFFMRRTFQGDKLYKLIFGQYISSLVSQGDSPIEFFIEGTRSRTGKSLKPKYGFLSMILKPFLAGEVPDIKLVPVSISYDRFLEEWLFARELLGTPKPKESTKGLFKVFSILNQNYGNVYFNFGEPISIHDWISREVDCPLSRPISQDVKNIASLILQNHSKLQVLGAFHLVMVILYDNLVTHNLCEMPIGLATNRFKVLLSAMRALSLNVLLTKGDMLKEIHYACTINPELMVVGGEKLKFLGKCEQVVQAVPSSRKSETIETGKGLDPNKVVLLVVYTNPVAMVLFPPALLLVIIATNGLAMIDEFNFLCELFENEFPIGICDKENNVKTSEKFLLEMDCVCLCPDGVKYALSSNYQLINILNSIIHPYLLGYLLISQYLVQVTDFTVQKKLLADCQNHLKMKSQSDSNALSPIYSSKSFVTHCLSALAQIGCLHKQTSCDVPDAYSINHDRLFYTISLLDSISILTRTECALKNKL
uniref:Dihydroxyacetone phosphate acyltransferase n=2 Tax=Lygus hesperus TaxID=30085 RepID=A0A0A9YYS2_LYGHE